MNTAKDYRDSAESAKTAAELARDAAEAARIAAEAARDEASEIVGGDYVTTSQLQAAMARTYSIGTDQSFTLSASGWSTTQPYQQTITLSGVTVNPATQDIEFSLSSTNASEVEAATKACFSILPVSGTQNQFMFVVNGTKPNIDIGVKFRVNNIK